jgi:tetratricopeptide (TPR) repeat protein
MAIDETLQDTDSGIVRAMEGKEKEAGTGVLRSMARSKPVRYLCGVLAGFAALYAVETIASSIKEGRPVAGISRAYAGGGDTTLASKLNNEGISLYQKGDYAQAEGKFREAIKADPSYADAYSMLGSALLDQGKEKEALTYAEKALKMNPNFMTFFKAAEANKANKNYKEALAQYTKAQEMHKLKPNYKPRHDQIYQKEIDLCKGKLR